MDLCEYKKKMYLVTVDYYSRYLEVVYVPDIKASTIVAKTKTMFAHWGIPDEVMTDNGTQFTASQFQDFAKKYGFTHSTSSPHYPRSNGEAERGVQTAKKILGQKDPWLALMTYRASPVAQTGKSPSQLMMGRQIRTSLPVMQQTLDPEWPDKEKVRTNDEKSKQRNADYYNVGTQPLSPLHPGDIVRRKTGKEDQWSPPSQVVQEHASPRSYVVSDGNGTYRRNRAHLMKVPDASPPSTENSGNSNEGLTQQTPRRSPAGKETPATPSTPTTPNLRRSQRTKKPPAWMLGTEFQKD